MKRLAVTLALSLVFTLGGCVGFARRPASVAHNAVFSGGIKGGTWITCAAQGEVQTCDIRNYKGQLYERGTFTLAANIDPCYPTFIVGDYRFNGNFLIPITVRQIRQDILVQRKNASQNLESAISSAFLEHRGITPSSVALHLEGQCQNGFYEIVLPNNKKQTGRVWGGTFFQVWPISGG